MTRTLLLMSICTFDEKSKWEAMVKDKELKEYNSLTMHTTL